MWSDRNYENGSKFQEKPLSKLPNISKLERVHYLHSVLVAWNPEIFYTGLNIFKYLFLLSRKTATYGVILKLASFPRHKIRKALELHARKISNNSFYFFGHIFRKNKSVARKWFIAYSGSRLIFPKNMAKEIEWVVWIFSINYSFLLEPPTVGFKTFRQFTNRTMSTNRMSRFRTMELEYF